MILEIKYWPDICLKKIAHEVTDFDGTNTDQIIDNLFETMTKNNGMGLAATQCDIQLRILVIDTYHAGTGKIKKAFINPTIKEKTEKTIISEEGCLSFPGVFVNILRAEGVVIENTTLTEDQEEVILNGVDAICFQHELDHLNGIVFFDHLKAAKRIMMEQKLRKNIKKLRRNK